MFRWSPAALEVENFLRGVERPGNGIQVALQEQEELSTAGPTLQHVSARRGPSLLSKPLFLQFNSCPFPLVNLLSSWGSRV